MQSFRYSRDPDKINILIAIIPRDNLLNKKETVVCESYLPADCETVCDYWKLQTCDPPLMFGFVRLSLNPAVLLTIRTAKKKKKKSEGSKSWWYRWVGTFSWKGYSWYYKGHSRKVELQWVCCYIIRVWWNTDNSIKRLSVIISCVKIFFPYRS